MGNTRNFFKKIGDIMGTYYERMGTIKEKNSKDLTQAEEIKWSTIKAVIREKFTVVNAYVKKRRAFK